MTAPSSQAAPDLASLLAGVLAEHKIWRGFCPCGWEVSHKSWEPWVDAYRAHVAAEQAKAVSAALLSEAVVEVAAIAETAQLVCYTLPANYNQPVGNQTHEDVAVRCGPINARAALTAALSALTPDPAEES